MLSASGSSPRVRGTRRRRRSERRDAAVHPRACGEHEGGVDPKGAMQRFIPARAGNTMVSGCPELRRSVHPRACGEHTAIAAINIAARGSSPRVRGTHCARRYKPELRRFIPARAGNTDSLLNCSLIWPVHPRACGEHAIGAARQQPLFGSSPRVRGTLCGLDIARQSHRFIPARAGNTCRPDLPIPRSAVHPRACGEHSSCRVL